MIDFDNNKDITFYKYQKQNKPKIKDSDTQLFVILNNDMYLVKVDGGIIRDNIKKCDYMIYDKIDKHIYFIELKGKNIDDAFEQIYNTQRLLFVDENSSCSLKDLEKNIVFGFIVSPKGRSVPRSTNKETELAESLAKLCKKEFRPKKLTHLIKYVESLKNSKEKNYDNGDSSIIVCSNGSPLPLPLKLPTAKYSKR